MKMTRIEAAGYKVTVFDPEAGRCPVLYSGFDEKEVNSLHEKMQKPFAAVCWEGEDWDNDMTPWPAEKVFRDGRNFGGGADIFIEKLVGEILPAAEAVLGFQPETRCIAGYSLSGLFAMYAAYKTDKFSAAASMSGSMWYDGWIEFMETHRSPLKKAYFSVGSREKNTRNLRMATVEDCTRKACDILKAQGVETIFELNPGNHFVDVENRIYKGVRWIL